MRGQSGRCPICRKPAVADYQPFCSKRCSDIDLGRWFDGRYAIPGRPANIADMDPEDGPDDSPDDDGERD